MEVKSSVLGKWNLFTLGCFCGSLLFYLFFDKIQQNTIFLGGKTTTVALAPSMVELLDPPTSITKPTNTTNLTITSPTFKQNATHVIIMEKQTKITPNKCDIFDGRWVYRPEENPRYDAMRCSFLNTAVRCQENGRSDFEYVKWRWEAIDCDIPLFHGKEVLQRLRNKRVIMVGDSLNRNMWESLACLIYTSIPSSKAEVNVKNGAHRILKAKDYNFTLEFYMSPFLTELSKKHKSRRKVLILDKISSSSKQWIGADIMIFNSGHWWTHKKGIKKWDVFQYKGSLIEELPRELAFKRAMRTWASWIKKHVDPKKTSVFFRSISPSHNHQKSDQWCYNVTKPMMGDSYLGFPKSLVDVIEDIIKGMGKLNIKYLNITELSQHRSDAHPSIFSVDLKTFNEKYYDNLSHGADCSHWCLPGLPDTWNRLLYASIFFDSIDSQQ